MLATGRRTRGAITARWYVPYLFLAPALVVLVLNFVWPVAMTVQLSMARYDAIRPLKYVGLGNFSRLLHDDRFWTSLTNSLLVFVMLLPFTVVIPLLLAVLLNNRLRGIGVFRLVYYLPVVTSMVAVAVAWRFLLDRAGVLNWLMSLAGRSGSPIAFLLDSHWALPSIVLVEGWKGMGVYIMIFLAGLQAVPTDLLEAAALDGAGAWQRTTRIVVPLLRPVILVSITLTILAAMQLFESVYLLTRGGPGDATLTLGYYIWSTAFEGHELGYASALGIACWVVMVGLSMLNLLARRRSA